MDLRHVDLHISEQKLTIKSASFKSYFAFYFDLKAGYHHFDIFPNCHKYLAFSWDFGIGYVRHFQFTVLPFVLSSAPFTFIKLRYLWKPIKGDKKLQSLSFSMTVSEQVPRKILLCPTSFC